MMATGAARATAALGGDMKRAVTTCAGVCVTAVAVLALHGAALCADGSITGSGIVIGNRGEILTNAHVVDRCDTITVQFASKKTDAAVMVARDQTNDLALLRVANPPPAVAVFRDGAPVRAGDTVVALGYPLPSLLSSSATLTVGYVSALAGFEDDKRYLQISAPVQPGNSGGPLLDASGHLAGIVTSKLNAENVARFIGDIPQNVNFAIKAEVVRTFLDSKGIAYKTQRSDQQLSPADVGEVAQPFTVYVECRRGIARAAVDRADRTRRQPNAGEKIPGAMAQQLRLCEGGDGASSDDQIAGCTAVIRSGVPNDKELAALLNYRGVAYKAKGDLDHAIADYTEAIRRDPDYATAYNSRGIAYKAKGDLDHAIADYDQAIRLNPNSAPAFNNRGYAYFAKSSYDRAVTDFDEAVKLDPQYALAYNNRGYAYFMQKNYDRAISDYDQAIRIDPLPAVAAVGGGSGNGRSHVNIYVNRGVAYALKGDFDHALSDYYEAIRIDPNYARAFGSRGHVFRHIGNYARAISDYSEALRLDPSDTGFYADRGFAHFLKADYPQATADLAEAIARLPEPYPILWRYLARARAGGDGAAELAAAAAQLKTKAWPYPVVEFYLGKRTAEDMAGAAAGAEERCEAQFYVGEWRLMRGDRAKAKEALEAAQATCPQSFYEYDGAVAELAHIDR
jgi:tetratricopeptide (TPR) repeat protein